MLRLQNVQAKNFHIVPLWVRRILTLAIAGPNRTQSGTSFKLVILKLDRIGDFVLSLGAIRRLLERWGEENSLLIVSPGVAAFAQSQFPHVSIYELPAFGAAIFRGMLPVWWKHSRFLRGLKVENLICLRHQRTIYHNLILSWISATNSFGVVDPEWCLNEKEKDLLPFSADTLLAYPEAQTNGTSRIPSELEAHRQLVSSALQKPLSSDQILPRIVPPKTLPGYNDAVIISPYGSTAIRSYDGIKLLELLKLLQEKGIRRLVLSGDQSRRDDLLRLRNDACECGFSNIEVLPECSLPDFISIIHSSRGVISVETATAHIAIALDRPTLGILGGGHYGYYAPWNKSARQKWINHNLPCYNCNWECIYREPFCITKIPPKEVADAFFNLLHSSENQ